MKKIEAIKKTFEGINFVPSKKFVTPRTVEPGMFYYADGLIYPELIKGNQVGAIVAGVEKNHGLAMGLRETVLPWSSDCLYVGVSQETCGKEATKRILDAAKKKGKSAEAFEWCAAYAYDGIEAGTMFMPGNVEWRKITVDCHQLRKPFGNLNLKGLCEDDFYLSSSEVYGYGYYGGAWVVRPSDGNMANNLKYYVFRVRCVLEFKL